MTRPPYGLSIPVQYVRTRDADSVEVRIPGSAFVWALRLIDVWAPETNRGDLELRKLAAQGKNWVDALLSALKPELLSAYIPLPMNTQPLKSLTFDRVPAWIFLNTIDTLNALVVKEGFASSTKGGPLGT